MPGHLSLPPAEEDARGISGWQVRRFLSGTNLRGNFALLEAVSPPMLCSDHMPWLSKEQLTPLDSQPVSGLYALHGDVMASAYQREDLRSLTYPLIRFPSGITRELTVDNDSANILVAGGLTVAYSGGAAAALEAVRETTGERGLLAYLEDDHTLVILDPETRRATRLDYDRRENHLANVVRFPEHAMDLLDGETRAALPPLRSTERLGRNALARAKFFTPDANWTWYATEFDGDDLFFGLVSGFELEYGYFSLRELEGIQGGLALPVERDLHYHPEPLHAIEARHRR
ncbi:MAG: DUF2958 domain-containing protein [Anaerolineae bacterium]|nr:DUF2958 domain-containing protein [Anaerolineae bacterium]